MIVEDGSGVTDADAYSAEAPFQAWLTERGLTVPAGASISAGLIAGAAWLDGRFRARLPGRRARGREQGLEWPRVNAADCEGYAIPDNIVPREWIIASWIATHQHLTSPGSLYPVASGSSTAVVKRQKLGSMEVEYDTATAEVVGAISLTAVDDVLAGLLVIGAAQVALLRA